MAFRMIKTMRNRYNEVKARKEMGIKMNWFEPLSPAEAEKLASRKAKELLLP